MTSGLTHTPTSDDHSTVAEDERATGAALVAVAFSDGTGSLTETGSGRQEHVREDTLEAACGRLFGLLRAHATAAGRPVDVELRTPGLQPWRLRVDQDGITAPAAEESAATLPSPVAAPKVTQAKPAAAPQRTEDRSAGAELAATRRGRRPVVAALAGLAAVALAGGLLLRGCDNAAPSPRTPRPTAAVTSAPSVTTSPTTSTSPTTPPPAPAVLSIRAITPAGGPLRLVISTPPASTDRALRVVLRAGDAHGHVIAAKTLTLPAGHPAARITFNAAKSGVFSWQATGPTIQPATGTVTVPPAPKPPSTTTGSTRPPVQHSSSTSGSSGTSHHSAPKHHSTKPSSQPTKISVSVPPSPIDRSASREGLQ